MNFARIRCLFFCLCFFSMGIALVAKPSLDSLMGEYADQTEKQLVLEIKVLNEYDLLIVDSNGVLFSEDVRISILDEKKMEMSGMSISNYTTTDKNIRLSKVNGVVTLTVFTQDKTFIGKKIIKK